MILSPDPAGRPHHFITDDGHVVVTREGVTPEDVLAEAVADREPTYAEKRSQEYPSFADQFDILYHEGVEGLRSRLAAIKAKHPK